MFLTMKLKSQCLITARCTPSIRYHEQGRELSYDQNRP